MTFTVTNISTSLGYSVPLNSLREVVTSGFPIKMYGIGAAIEDEWARSGDPDIRMFMAKRQVLAFDHTFQELDEVARGETVLVDWLSTALTTIPMRSGGGMFCLKK